MATLHKLDHTSHDSAAPELDLFSVPVTKTSVLDGEIVEVTPLTSMTDTQIEFEIEAENEHYLDLENTLLHVEAKLVKKDGSPLGAGDSPVITANNLLHSMFSSVSLQINGKTIEEETNYPYRVYLEKLLNASRASKTTHLRASGWFEDSDDKLLGTANIPASSKPTLVNRVKFLEESKIFELTGPLHTSLSQQERYLLPGLSVRIKLHRASSAFILQKLDASDVNDYVVKITSAKLLCYMRKINPSIQTAHMKLLSQGNKAKYPITRVETQFFTISPGRQSEHITILQRRQEPKRVFVAMVDHTAKNGSYSQNPFRFEHNNVSAVNFKVGGHLKPPTPVEIDFTTNKYTRPYLELMSVCGKAFMSEDNGITLEEFANGKTIFCLDNTPDHCRGDGIHLFRQTNTSVEITFKEPLTATTSLFVYSEFDDILEIDNSRVPFLKTSSTA